MSLRATASFDRRWSLFWATTYTFEPVFFESFLLPRLGDPPLNATILADAYRYADALQDLSTDAPWRSTRANRDYLIRGVVVTGGAFHPKTYLFGDETGGRLLVGSGNLAMSGLETGKELFAAFESGEPAGLATIRAWRAWMDDLVAEIDDQAVRDRWRDAQVRAPWLVGPAEPSAFTTNWDRPLMDSILDGIEAPVDELHLTAPFFDEHAAAVAELLRRTRPARVEMLLGRDASVHGPALISALEASGAEVVLHGLDPELFVHGKLVGLVWQGRGRILSGSANLSTAALLRTVRQDAHANVECGVIAETTPDQVRAAFAPPPPPAGLAVVPKLLESLAALAFAPGKETRFPYLLRSATWLTDGRVRVDLEVSPTEQLDLRCETASSPLADLVTLTPFADDTARLVWIATPTGSSARTRSRSTNRDRSAPHSRIAARQRAPTARVGWRQRIWKRRSASCLPVSTRPASSTSTRRPLPAGSGARSRTPKTPSSGTAWRARTCGPTLASPDTTSCTSISSCSMGCSSISHGCATRCHRCRCPTHWEGLRRPLAAPGRGSSGRPTRSSRCGSSTSSSAGAPHWPIHDSLGSARSRKSATSRRSSARSTSAGPNATCRNIDSCRSSACS